MLINDVFFWFGFCKAEFILDEFEATQIFQNNVHLDLRIIYSCNIQNSVALVDGLIWSIHPSTLSIEGGCYEFIKVTHNSTV